MSLECDVLVVGGGSAGLAAAVAASRSGARVVLAECSLLGGNGSSALVHTFCGLYEFDGDAPVYANQGLATELPERMIQAKIAGPPVKMGRLWVLPHEPTRLPAFVGNVLAESGVQILPVQSLAGGNMTEGQLQRVRFALVTGEVEIHCRAAIDASGDAVLASALGCAVDSAPPEELQRSAFVAQLTGLPGAWLEPERRLQMAASIAAEVRDGALPDTCLGAAFRRGRLEEFAWCTVDLPGDGVGDYRPADSEWRQRLWELGRRTVDSLITHLAKLTNAAVQVAQWPKSVGIRESRRLVGKYVLTGDDLLRGEQFADGVARVSWPMEFRERAVGPRLRFPESRTLAQVPRRCLQADGLANLFAAGRCLSANHAAQAAIRVMGLCLATGEAAGRAAAHFAKQS